MKENKRAITLLLIANSISGISQGISMLAIPWYFSSIDKQSVLFSKIYIFSNFLSMIWGIYAGTLVDRYNRKNLFIAINIAGLVVLSTIAFIGKSSFPIGWLGPAIVFITTVLIYNVHFPALYAFAQEITPKEQYKKITSKLEIQGQITWTIAGGLAAILLSGFDGDFMFNNIHYQLPFSVAAWDISSVFLLDACTYVVAIVLIYSIKTTAVIERNIDHSHLFDRLSNGIIFLYKNPLMFIFGNASLLVFLTILVHSTLVNPLYVTNFLHRDASVYASADMVFSMGALLAGFFAAKFIKDEKLITSIFLLCLLAACLYIFHVFTKNLIVYFATYFVIGTCNSAIRIQRVTYFFHHISNDIIGRTGSIFFVINVLERMMLTGILALPFFHTAENIAYANAILSAICLIGGLTIFYYRKKLTHIQIHPN